jgi:hypothetical protein
MRDIGNWCMETVITACINTLYSQIYLKMFLIIAVKLIKEKSILLEEAGSLSLLYVSAKLSLTPVSYNSDSFLCEENHLLC